MSAELATPDGAAELAGLYTARAALEASRDLAEIKQIHDTALAAKRYAEAKKLGAEMTGYAQEIVNRAERRIGQVLAETPRQQGGGKGSGPEPLPLPSPRQEAGKKLSARSQRLAWLDEETFERLVRKPVTRLDRITRDRLAEARRRERSAAMNDVAPITGWEVTESAITLEDRLLLIADHLHAPRLRRDASGDALADPWHRPGRHSVWELDDLQRPEDGARQALAEAAKEARAELDTAISTYEAALAEAAEQARVAASRIAGMLREAANDAPPDLVLYKTTSYRSTAARAWQAAP